jgi:hypothetical protein
LEVADEEFAEEGFRNDLGGPGVEASWEEFRGGVTCAHILCGESLFYLPRISLAVMDGPLSLVGQLQGNG